ncbi:hypothetical protein [Roseospira visakhapatnamensis]|uniref:Uncharacterized protein n=1 Tax=Roseospira visakhapatnamensis TaxID=390880 RepID=A0A7W6RAT6_9PROT|nr:hypothetical protein [Roseospira visakhapatnamensis]MBB4264509.1 hypothetical protein [Roseospira visakhapatnamensis]
MSRPGGGEVTRIHGTVGRNGAVEFVRDTGPRGADPWDQIVTGGDLFEGGAAPRPWPARHGWYAERR